MLKAKSCYTFNMGDLQDERARKALGRKLKIARKNKKYTQVEMAERADIHVNYYARIERGEENPSFQVLQAIAKALRVKLSDILPS